MLSNRLVIAVICVLIGVPLACLSESHWNMKTTYQIGGEGGWDYVTVDAQNHRLFVTRTSHTQVIDADSGRVIGDISGQKTSHGVALVPSLNRGFITDGGDSGAIVVFDLTTYAVLGRIPALPDADGIIYDEKTDHVLAVSGDGGVLMTFRPDIDPQNGKIDPPIALDGKPEFLVTDGSGKVYVNLVNKDVVAVVDMNSRRVIARWPVAPGGRPVGMSMDPASRRLFVGCRNPQKLIVMNADDGTVESALPIGAGVDATVYYDGAAFASCRDGSLISARSGSKGFEITQTVKTPEGARTMGVDRSTHRIYLPTAEFEAVTAGKPKPKPGTFKIVVVDEQWQ
jgi:outer membrane protein assembly factor BamB